MKRISLILCGALMLAACQQSEDKAAKEADKDAAAKEPTVKEQPAQNAELETAKAETEKAAEESHKHGPEDDHKHDEAHQHDELAKSGEPFVEVKGEYACEAPVVVEFFAYQCPHCYALEPEAEAWRKKNAGKVKFVSVPTHLGRNEFGSLLLVHHAAEKLGVLEKTQHALFKRVHEEKKLFASPEDAADFLAAQGADREQALTALNDQEAMGKEIDADFQMMAKYKITSVPRVIVNHQYMTDIASAGGADKVYQLVDELLAKEHNCKTKADS